VTKYSGCASCLMVTPSVVATLAPAADAVGPLGGPAVDTRVMFGGPTPNALTVLGNEESPVLALAALHRSFPEANGGLRWVPPGGVDAKTPMCLCIVQARPISADML
jgi:hypothetical protein